MAESDQNNIRPAKSSIPIKEVYLKSFEDSNLGMDDSASDDGWNASKEPKMPQPNADCIESAKRDLPELITDGRFYDYYDPESKQFCIWVGYVYKALKENGHSLSAAYWAVYFLIRDESLILSQALIDIVTTEKLWENWRNRQSDSVETKKDPSQEKSTTEEIIPELIKAKEISESKQIPSEQYETALNHLSPLRRKMVKALYNNHGRMSTRAFETAVWSKISFKTQGEIRTAKKLCNQDLVKIGVEFEIKLSFKKTNDFVELRMIR